MKKQFLEAGRIVSTHGTRGEIKIQPWADEPAFLTRFKTFYLNEQPVKVRSCYVQKTMVVASLEGVDDINTAMTLKDRILFINRDDVALPEGVFFEQDLLGCRVVDEADTELGVLADILEEPAAAVFVVKGRREILVPNVPAFVLEKNPEAGFIRVRLIEGM